MLIAAYGNKEGKGMLRAKKKLAFTHSLTNFKIQKHYQSRPRSSGVYSRDNLP